MKGKYSLQGKKCFLQPLFFIMNHKYAKVKTGQKLLRDFKSASIPKIFLPGRNGCTKKHLKVCADFHS